MMLLEQLEERRMLTGSTDLTSSISNLLTSGDVSGSYTFNNATVGSFLTVPSVTVGLSNISEIDSTHWNGTISVDATSASVAIGSTFTGSTGTLHGSYTLTNEPLDGGAYDLKASSVALTAANVFNATASTVEFGYDPAAAAGQTLATIGTASATITPLNGATVSLSNLVVRDNGFTLGDALASTPSFSLGGILSATSSTIGFSNVSYTVGSPLTGTITAKTDSVSLFASQAGFSDPGGAATGNGLNLTGFSGSYDLAGNVLTLAATGAHLAIGKVIDATATGVSIGYSSSDAVTVSVASLTATSPLFPGITGTLTNLNVSSTGVSLDSATFSAASVTLGRVFNVTNLDFGLTNGFSYNASNGSFAAGTLAITADSAVLFPGQSAFTDSVTTFAGSYTFSTGALALSAAAVDLNFGKFLSAKATGVNVGWDGTNATVALAGATITSGYFSTLSGKLTGVTADNTGLKISSIALEDSGTSSIGKVFSITDLKLGVTNLNYSTTSKSVTADTATVSAASAVLFPGQTAFTDSVTNFTGSYTFSNSNLALSAGEVDLGLGKALSVKATGVQVNWDGTSASVVLAGATITSGYFPGVSGMLTGVTANDTGLTIDGATLSDTGTVSIGSFFQFNGLTVTVNGFNYSTTTKAIGAGSLAITTASATLFPNKPAITDTVKNFVGSYDFTSGNLSLMAGEVDLNFGKYVTATANNLSVKWDGTTAVITLGTGTFNAQIGSYLSLSGTGSINTSPAAGGDFADIDSLPAHLGVGRLAVTGTATNFAIDNAGNLDTEPGKTFGASLTLNDSSQIQWPTWLPISVSQLGVNWPSFATDPTNFSLTLTATVGASFVGGKLSISGSVTNAVIDVGMLAAGQFPITSIAGASLFASGSIAGGTVSGGAFISILNVDANNMPIADGSSTTVARRIFYGGITAGFTIQGAFGFDIKIGLSQLGPLTGYVDAAVPILLDPTTGLAITNLHAGIDFNRTLPATTNAKTLTTNPAFTPLGNLTFAQWMARLQTQVISQAASGNTDPFAALAQPLVIDAGATIYSEYASTKAFRIDGDIQISTDGKILVTGTATVGNTLSLNAGAYFDLSQVSAGTAVLLIYLQAPANVPILSVYGSVIIQAGSDLNLNGTTASASIANTSLSNSSFTVEFWSRRTDSGKAEVVASEGNTAFQAGYDAQNNFYVGFGSSRLTTTAATDGKWHHWAITYDKPSQTRTLYEDGVAVATDSHVAAVLTSDTTLLIGQAGMTYFNGSVDAVRVWTLARTGPQVGAEFNVANVGTDNAGLVGVWEFDSGPETSDTSVAGHPLTINGTPLWSLPAGQLRAPVGADGFSITIGATVDVTLPGVSGGLEIVGSATFATNIALASVDLSLSGTATLLPLGQFASIVGNVHFDVNAAMTPEIYGVFEVNLANLPLFAKLGLTLAATGFVEFNTTPILQDVKLTLPNTTTTQDYMVAGQTVMLYVPSAHIGYAVSGTQIFEVDADLYARFSVATLANGSTDAELDLAFNGNILIGPGTGGLLNLAANGVFILNTNGLAASITVMLNNSAGLKADGVTLTGTSLTFALNTFSKDVSFTTPDIYGGQDGQTLFPGQKYLVPGIPSIANPPATASPYVLIAGSVGLAVGSFALAGNFDILVTPTVFRIDVLAASLSYTDSSGNKVFSLTANGGLALYNDPTRNDVGFAGLINASIGAGQGIGTSSLFSITGTFTFEVNTASIANTIGTTTIPKTTTELDVAGDLKVGPANAQFDISGTLQIIINGDGLSASVSGRAALGALGTLTVGSATDSTKPATLVINSSGLSGSVGLYGSASPIAGTSLTGAFTFQINTATSLFIVQVVGDLTVAGGIFDLQGMFKLSLTPPSSGSGPDTFTIVATASVSVLGAKLGSAEFFASIYNDGSPELALYVGLSITSGSLGTTLFNFNVSPDLVINTGSQTISTGLPDYTSIAPAMGQFELKHATGTILGFTVSGTLIATFNSNGFDFLIPQSEPLSLSFLGLGSMQIYGDINSDGTFSVTGLIRYDVSIGPFELYGGIGATIADTGFAAWFYGGANLDCGVLGVVNLASVSAYISVMTDHLEIAASLKVLGIGFSFDTSLGSYSPPPHNAGLNFYNVPTAAPAGSVVTLTGNAYDSRNQVNLSGTQLDWEVYGPGGYHMSGSGTKFAPTLAGTGVYSVYLYDQYQYDGHLLLKQSNINVFALPPAIGSLNLQATYLAGVSNGAQDTVTLSPSDTVANAAITTVTYAITKNGAAWSGQVSFNSDLGLTITPDTPDPSAKHPDVYAITYTISDPYNGSATATGSFTTLDIHHLTVNSTADTEVVDPKTGNLIYVAGGVMTLRQAIDIIDDNLYPNDGFATISFDPSLAGQTIGLYNEEIYFDAPNGYTDLRIDGAIVIDGSDAPGLTIAGLSTNPINGQAVPARRIFYVSSEASLTLDNVNVTGGKYQTHGNDGGGAAYVDSYGVLRVNNSAIYNNSATGFSGDQDDNPQGGAIYVASQGEFDAINSTLFYNTVTASTYAASQGGAIYSAGGYVRLVNATIALNTASATSSGYPAGGGAIYGSYGSNFTILNSILSNNTGGNDLQVESGVNFYVGSADNIITSSSSNVPKTIPGFSQGSSFPFIYSSADPLLGVPTRRNGIASFSILPSSAAIGHGSTVLYTNESQTATDARGLARIVNGLIDIGAFERQSYVVTNPYSSGLNSLGEALSADDDGSLITFASNLTGIAVAGVNTVRDSNGNVTSMTPFNFGPLEISYNNITIVGPSGGALAISGNHATRLFRVDRGVTASISNLSLLNGQANLGGAIDNFGTLTLTNDLFSNNVAQGDTTANLAGLGAGGAIYNATGASLTVTGSTFSYNQAIGAPGLLQLSSFDGRAHAYDGGQGHGGAIDNESKASLTLSNDTFGFNSAIGGNGVYGTLYNLFYPYITYVQGVGGSGYGGGLVNYGTANVSNVTFANQRAAAGTGSPNGYSEAADILNSSGANLILTNSIAAYSQGGTDVYNQGSLNGNSDLAMTSYNTPFGLILSSSDPLLRPLGNYGGPTPTFELIDGSPAIGKAYLGSTVSKDQRGFAPDSTKVQDLGSFQLRHGFVVTNTSDSGPGSLRQVLVDDIDETPITFASSLSGQTIVLKAGPITLTRDVTIVGLGANQLTISDPYFTFAFSTFSVFKIGANVNATISGITIANGMTFLGGGIYNAGNLKLINDSFSNNTAQGQTGYGNLDPGGLGAGGAIYNDSGATLTVTGSSFLNNSAIGGAGTYVFTNDYSTLSGGQGLGGAILNQVNARVTLIDDTFNGNSAVGGNAYGSALGSGIAPGTGGSGYGGGLVNYGTAIITNDTFVSGGVTAGTGGPGGQAGYATVADILNSAGATLTLYNTITVYGRSGTYDVLNQGKATGGSNIAGTFGGLNPGIIASTADPRLASLAYNQGTTQSFAINAQSFALGGGNVAVAPTTDQRGLARIVGGSTDIGAFETQVIPVTASAGVAQTIHAGHSFVLNASGTVNPSNSNLNYTWTISGNGSVTTVNTFSFPTYYESSYGFAVGTYQITVTVDDGLGGNHAVTAVSSLTILPAITITSVTPAVSSPAVNATFDTVDVAFPIPIDPTSLANFAATFTRQGGADLAHPSGITLISASLVAGTTSTYRISGLASLMSQNGQGQYTLTINGAKVTDPYGSGSGAMSVTWIYDTTAPTSKVAPLPSSVTGTTFTVTAGGSDPTPATGVIISGLASYDIWVSNNGGAFTFWTNVPASSPSAVFTGTPGNSYAFQSFARDGAGNLEVKAAANEAGTYLTSVSNQTLPTASVTSVDATTSTFQILFAGTAVNGNVLDHIDVYVSVDGNAPQMIGRSTAGSGSINYQAIADGHVHHYGFFALGTDKVGNAGVIPTGPAYDQNITATPFAAPASNSPIGLSVNHGSKDRSFVRYVDLIFANNSNLASLISGNNVHLVQHNLDGTSGTPVSLAGDLTVVDHAIEFDFGASGLGGANRSTIGDGYYEIDVDGFTTPFYFDRLLGDINGDGLIDNSDIALMTASLGNTASNQATDFDGTGTVTTADRTIVQKLRGRQVGVGLHLDA